ncbi:PadR family transcriptional regulator [candidate division KSB1 bacterium]|nr:PadR family transcriptional regulator [candidate division KSB1 bacterium]
MTLSNAEAALLGLLAEKPRHPYEIEKEVQMRDMRQWTGLSMSSIYKLLRNLEKSGAVTSHAEISDDNRARRIYHLTDAGTALLQDKLRQLLREPEFPKWRIDIATSNIALLPRTEALACLAEYRSNLQKAEKCYHELADYLTCAGCPAYRQSLARRPIHLIRAEIAWVDEFTAQLEETA